MIYRPLKLYNVEDISSQLKTKQQSAFKSTLLVEQVDKFNKTLKVDRDATSISILKRFKNARIRTMGNDSI